MSKKSSVKRCSAKRKQEVVLRLLRGESLDALSREIGQPAAILSQWRDEFLEGGVAALKRRTDDPKVVALEQELKRAKRLVGDLMRQTRNCWRCALPASRGVPFSEAEVESITRACSVSAQRVYDKARWCRLWGVARSTHDARQAVAERAVQSRRQGRKPVLPNEALVEKIREVLSEAEALGFRGEGYRKVWARLRHRGSQPRRLTLIHKSFPKGTNRKMSDQIKHHILLRGRYPVCRR